ncbi:small-subunit processome, Utp14 [Kipferlia bialata]|uniref:Small-subunit processome, Utp14 n=1 Tax=Kipferlia bialata TaxID=797122 RepID=A0A9K3CPQ2_9EUKA|nr:small-subunit processome, Utp14 [Kipferlia bialata]|eukprot:g812.t1
MEIKGAKAAARAKRVFDDAKLKRWKRIKSRKFRKVHNAKAKAEKAARLALGEKKTRRQAIASTEDEATQAMAQAREIDAVERGSGMSHRGLFEDSDEETDSEEESGAEGEGEGEGKKGDDAPDSALFGLDFMKKAEARDKAQRKAERERRAGGTGADTSGTEVGYMTFGGPQGAEGEAEEEDSDVEGVQAEEAQREREREAEAGKAAAEAAAEAERERETQRARDKADQREREKAGLAMGTRNVRKTATLSQWLGSNAAEESESDSESEEEVMITTAGGDGTGGKGERQGENDDVLREAFGSVAVNTLEDMLEEPAPKRTQDEDMPGFGSWTGPGVKKKKKRKNKNNNAAFAREARKKAEVVGKQIRAIINDSHERKGVNKLVLKKAGHGTGTAVQHNAAIQSVSREWTSAGGHRRAIMPDVIIRKGAVIEAAKMNKGLAKDARNRERALVRRKAKKMAKEAQE